MMTISFKTEFKDMDTIEIDGQTYDVNVGVNRVMIVGPVDEDTCLECMQYAGQVFEADDPEIQPFYEGGLHPNCRHFVKPLFGEPDKVQTPEQKFNNMSDEDQKSAMGLAIFTLYKEGTISWDDLFKKNGEVRTLAEIQSLIKKSRKRG